MSSYITDLSIVTSPDEHGSDDSVDFSISDVKNKLLAFGINTSIDTYSSEVKSVAYEFLDSSLENISDVWSDLNNNAKIRVLDTHSEEFARWVSSYGK